MTILASMNTDKVLMKISNGSLAANAVVSEVAEAREGDRRKNELNRIEDSIILLLPLLISGPDKLFSCTSLRFIPICVSV